jgi:hypothetical protein
MRRLKARACVRIACSDLSDETNLPTTTIVVTPKEYPPSVKFIGGKK